MQYVYLIISLFTILNILFVARVNEYAGLRGFWNAPADFCAEAGLTMFVMFIGDPVGINVWRRRGYLLMRSSDGYLLNNPAEFTIRPHASTIMAFPFATNAKVSRKFALTIHWIGLAEEEDVPEFPRELTLIYYPMNRKIILEAPDADESSTGTNMSVFAAFYKDGQASDVAEKSVNCDAPKISNDELVTPLDEEYD
jgi:hypothetical protein